MGRRKGSPGAHPGERHHEAKLTDDLVREIRARRLRGETYLKIVDWLLVERDVDVSLSTAQYAGRGLTWKHVR